MTARTTIKICGITREEDLRAACVLGVDAVGFVLADASSRKLSLAQCAELCRATPPFVSRIVLVQDPSAAQIDALLASCPLDALQFHGHEDETFCNAARVPYFKAIAAEDFRRVGEWYPSARGLLVDSSIEGGSGRRFDWSLWPASPQPLILAGGLDPENVAAAMEQLRPAAVDVSSGVEDRPGVKNPEKMKEFIDAVRNADHRLLSIP